MSFSAGVPAASSRVELVHALPKGSGAHRQLRVERTEMTVELRDLRWAITAGKHRSLRQAAQTLNIRQSTLSRRLRDLEGRVGAELFERTNGGTRPTIAGREFLTAACRILAETEAAISKVRARSRGENGRLAIGVYASLSTGNMFATLVEHHRRYPEVEVHTVDGSHDQILCALASNTVDIAIMTTSRSSWGDRIFPLWNERIIIALQSHHPLASREIVHWSELACETILIPQRGPGPELERLLTTRLDARGPLHVLHQESGLDRLLSLVGAGYGVLLMLEGATGVQYENVTYREVHDDVGATRLDFGAYWSRSNENATLAPFLAMLRERYPDLSVAVPD